MGDARRSRCLEWLRRKSSLKKGQRLFTRALSLSGGFISRAKSHARRATSGEKLSASHGEESRGGGTRTEWGNIKAPDEIGPRRRDHTTAAT